MQTSLSNLLPPWNNVSSNSAMKSLNHLHSKSKEVWMQILGRENWNLNSTLMCRLWFCFCQGRKVEITCTMKSKSSFWLSTQSLLKLFYAIPFQRARIFVPSSTRFSSKSMPRLEESLGRLMLYHSWISLQWFVEWTCSTRQLSVRNQCSLWLPQLTSLLPSTGQLASFRTISDKRLLTRFMQVSLKRWKHSRKQMALTPRELSSTEMEWVRDKFKLSARQRSLRWKLH
jgi:hypothetical protein